MQDLEYTQNDCGRYINLNDGKLKMDAKQFSGGCQATPHSTLNMQMKEKQKQREKK